MTPWRVSHDWEPMLHLKGERKDGGWKRRRREDARKERRDNGQEE